MEVGQFYVHADLMAHGKNSQWTLPSSKHYLECNPETGSFHLLQSKQSWKFACTWLQDAIVVLRMSTDKYNMDVQCRSFVTHFLGKESDRF
jgi:hypothetical protein